MSNNKSIIEKLRTFYYSTLMPVNFVHKDKSLFSLPENILNINSIVDNSFSIKDILSSINNTSYEGMKSFYYKNDYNECFILLNLKDEKYIIVGPTINEEIYEGTINNIIRHNKLPIGIKTKLIKHYSTLMNIDNNKYYYCGKLLEILFGYEFLDTSEEFNDNEPLILSDKYFEKTIENRESLFHHPPYFLEQELLSKIKVGKLKDSLVLLKEINSLKRSKLAKDSIRSLKNSLICSITLFTRAAIEGGVQPEVAFTLSDSMIQEIENNHVISSLMNYEYKAVEQYVKVVKELSKTKYSNIIQQAISLIYKNLTTKLTLKEVSKAIYVHPNYLSSLFKKEMGVSFTEYITKIRVEESKYYIRYTNTKISDISLFYQFCNQSYFTQAFKKFVGLTPNEYREKFNQQNQ